MALELLLFIVGGLVGFFVAWYLYSKQKWSDKQGALNEKWKRQIAELEKEYEIKLEKTNSQIEKIKEENKTHIETIARQWEVKYVTDIKELEKIFKESEKIIKLKSVSSSRRSLVGKFIEKFVPFLDKVEYEPSDMHFLGQPVDYIIFKGLHQDNVESVIFLEVKTGDSKLTKREKSLKDTIEQRKVYWKELRIDTNDDVKPDKEMENEETSIKEIYDNIEHKIKSVKLSAPIAIKGSTDNLLDVVCPSCYKSIKLTDVKKHSLKEGINTKCPHCNRQVKITEEYLQ